jgi:hypothetical protein
LAGQALGGSGSIAANPPPDVDGFGKDQSILREIPEEFIIKNGYHTGLPGGLCIFIGTLLSRARIVFYQSMG